MFKVLIFLLHLIVLTSSFNICGDWTQYKGQKCFKIFVGPATQDYARQICQDHGASLITIKNQDEQEFLNKLLVKYGDFTFAWIGLSKSDNEYKWLDGTTAYYTNWDRKKDMNAPCVVISLPSGKWRAVSCSSTTPIVCQKMPGFDEIGTALENMGRSFSRQQEEISLLREELHRNNLDTEIQSQQTSIDKQSQKIDLLEKTIPLIKAFLENMAKVYVKQQTEINSLKEEKDSGIFKNVVENQQTIIDTQNDKIDALEKTLPRIKGYLENVGKRLGRQYNETTTLKEELESIKSGNVPIGFIYTQLPNQMSPEQMWPNMYWSEITSQFAGLFFRVEGAGSEPFGQTQQANQSVISTIDGSCYSKTGDKTPSTEYAQAPLKTNEFSGIHCIDGLEGMNGLYFYTTSGEVRPKNTAVRIWKRTA